MRRPVLAFSGLALFVLAGCSSASIPSSFDDPVGEAQSPIVFGTKDTTHTAVVAILANAGGNGFDECSGSIVHVANGEGYVLTAAHCCGGDPQDPNITPSLVIMANDYGPYENYIGNPNPPAPSYAVVSGSVSWDQAYNGNDHDFCMLRFSGANANTPTILLPPALPASDGLSANVNVEYVGYGVTVGQGNNNSLRYHATAPVNQGVNALTIKYSEGNGVGGPCEGDSGGPALLPAGAAQGSQTVVATTSYGDQTCAQFGVSSRVQSEIGTGKFITDYITNGGGVGSSTSASTGTGGGGTCDSCQQTVLAQGGTCFATLDTCGNDADCANIVNCQNGCGANDAACENNCFSMYPAGQADYNAIVACICNQGCVSQCAADCGGSGSGGASASSTGAGMSVGVTTGASGATGATSGVGGAGSTSVTGTSANATSGNGSGFSGAGGDDSNDDVRSNANQNSGCGCVQAGDSTPGSNAALGGLFFAALAISRRRRR